MSIGKVVSSVVSAVTGSGSKQSAEQVKAYAQGVVDKKVSEREAGLGPTRGKQYKEKLQADVDEFLKANPNATEADVDAFITKQDSKRYTDQMLGKLSEDYVMNKVRQRAKELQSDRWG